ncbi:hypothetical protein F2Q70_00044527 [Brassica cretica]|uniref:Uncharacterized protein n=1 Tax=Brassica cretica TaxID=69181 RepID=A0A8S9KHK9_BRACR|nr:hypothetical protein F2Q70_00044527 [Brassica cretica]
MNLWAVDGYLTAVCFYSGFALAPSVPTSPAFDFGRVTFFSSPKVIASSCLFESLKMHVRACWKFSVFSEQLKTVAFLARRSVRPDSTVGTLVKAVLFERFIHWVFFADGRSSAASLHWLFPEEDGGGHLL